MTNLLPADEAVYRLLATAWDPAQRPAAEAIPWSEVLRLAVPSNVGALVYAAIQPMREAVPPDVQQVLEQAFYWSATENTRVLHQLTGLREALSSVGAPLLLLKGAALAETLYADPALRPIGDIDLAISTDVVPACRKILAELGYIAVRVEHLPGSRLAHNNQERFEPPKPYRAWVELHWHILDVPYYLRRVPMDWFWKNTESLSIGGQAFQVLNPEANLIYLPAHLALHHQFGGLHSRLDLALLIVRNRDRLDWDQVLAAGQSFELVTVLRETLDHLAQCWPSLPIDEPRRRLHALRPSRTDERLFRLLAAPSRSITLDFYTTLVSLPDFATRARYAWVNLFPQPAYMVERYGVKAGWQLPCWYLFRLAYGLPRLARILPRARRLERERGR